jgi:hypothetical protein
MIPESPSSKRKKKRTSKSNEIQTTIRRPEVLVRGYYQAKVTGDTGAHPQPLNRVAAIGPEIDLAFPPQKLVLALRYEYEFLSENRAQGHTVSLVLTKRL